MHLLLRYVITTSLFLMLVTNLVALENKDIAVVLKAKGKVQVAKNKKSKIQLVKPGLGLNDGNLLRTGEQSLAVLVFSDDKSILKIRENSTVKIKGKRKKEGIFKTISLGLGELWAKVTRSSVPFRVATPSGVAAVKGTEFYTLYDKETGRMVIFCIEGIIELFNNLGKVIVNAGEKGIINKDQPPVKQLSGASEIPGWGSTDDQGELMEIEFQNEQGDKKKLKIRYDEK